MPVVVYIARCEKNGKQYVGITSEPLKRRVAKHVEQASRDPKFRFHRALKKHGVGNFTWEALQEVETWEEACEIEIRLIRELGTRNSEVGYNDTDGGEGRFGCHHSPETRRKMSESQKMRGPVSEETKEKMRVDWKTREPFSEESLRKMSEAQKRRRPISEETRQKLVRAWAKRREQKSA